MGTNSLEEARRKFHILLISIDILKFYILTFATGNAKFFF